MTRHDSTGGRARRIAICGGGNAGHALAIVTSQTFDGEVAWLVGSMDRADVLRERAIAGGLESTGVIAGRADRLRVVSSDPAEVVAGADIVIIAVPAFAHLPVLAQIAPHLGEDALLGCAPTRSGFEFEALRFIDGVAPHGRRVIFGLQTLPWSTRIVERGSVVNFGATKANVLMATMPHERAHELAPELTRLFGTEITPTANILDLTLGNPGQHIHPGLMHGHFRSWSGETFGEEDVPLFYKDATEDVSASVEALSDDSLAVARRLEAASGSTLDLSGVLPVHEWLRISYPTQTQDFTSVSSCFRTGPLQHRKAPMTDAGDGRLTPDFQYRYLNEDVPYGLVVTRAIAELAGVDTPALDRVIDWAQERMGVRYLVGGSLRGPDAGALPIPQNYGIDSLEALLDWYASPPDRVAAAPAEPAGG